VARASRGKETRASCSSANSILAPLRQVSETREPCAVELKTCVTSIRSVSETIRSLETLSLYPYIRSDRGSCQTSSLPSVLRLLPLSFSLPSRNLQAPASIPRQTPSYGRTVASTCHKSRATGHVPFPRRLHPRCLASEQRALTCGLDLEPNGCYALLRSR
jgi:hypothetical protein